MKQRLAAIAYGTGNLGQALFFNSVQTYLIYFYVDIVRLDSRLVGLAFALAYGVWNAINDPLAGAISDRTRSRWGRRIPYVLFGTPLALLLYILVWSPPLGGRPLADPLDWRLLAYFALVIALFDLANTVVSVAYTAIFPEAYEGLAERTEVSLYRQVAAAVGTALGVAAMPVLVDALSGPWGQFGGWSAAGVILGMVAAGAFAISLRGSRERPEASAREALPLGSAFRATLASRSFLAFAGANLMICYIWSWLAAMVPFFTKYVLRVGEGQTSLLFAGMFVAAIAFYPLWRRVALQLGSKTTLALAVSLFVLFLLPVILLRSLPQAIAMMFLVGAANSGITLVRDVVLSDVIDEDELQTGRRREGSYFGVNAFIERLVLVLVGGSTTLVLSASGYAPQLATQPATVATGIRLGMSLLPLAALGIFLLAMSHYPLGKGQVAVLRARLELARAGGGGEAR
ncbi:MAG: MFS transporter [Anaerolineae bacterium]|nr:MFS transporter [Anaerolineae bacterium]